MQVNGTWTPTIVAFCCNWCSYAGADLSGTNRLSYPANVKIIRIPCSCRLNPMFILSYSVCQPTRASFQISCSTL